MVGRPNCQVRFFMVKSTIRENMKNGQLTLDIIQKALADGRNVELRNFGVLEVQVRKARIGRNPNKPEAEVVIPQRAVVKFKSGKILKQQLKKLDLAKLQAGL